ncbi:MAG: hypothetical protein LBR64_02865 [Dysgonamonadaceae bacterium]|nr:hypothetical protein [Dysgonamonadaceae bacterium]
MKQLSLLILSLLLFSRVSAQQQVKDFAYINAKIDSIAAELSTETYKAPPDVYNIFANARISEADRIKIARKIQQMFVQERYANLYHLGHSLLARMWNIYPEQNTVKVNQLLLEIYLEYYYYPIKPSYDALIDIHYYDLNRRKNYTAKSKQRIFEIIKEQKTEKEFDIWFQYEKSFPPDTVFWGKIANKLLKEREIQNETVYIKIRDSLDAENIYNYTKREFDNLKISNDLIFMTGFLDMKECIPILQAQLPEAIANDNQWQQRERAIRYTLARLGDKQQKQYVIDNMLDYRQYFDRVYFSYFRDDELMWRFIDVNYHSDKRMNIDGDRTISAGLKAMSDVYPYIKNVPKELEFPYISNDINDDYKWAKALYEWMIKNKNKIKFDYDGEKKGFW